MLNLVAPTAFVALVTGSAVNAIGVHASYVDIAQSGGTTTVSPKPQNTSITGATTTPVVSPPGAGVARNVKFLSINNSSALPCAVTVQHFDGATTVDVFGPVTLQAGYTIQYNSDGRGFVQYDNLGNIL